MGNGHIAHRHGVIEAWRKPARADFAEHRAAFSAVIERHAMAHRRPALRFQAHAFARDGLWKFGQNTRCAWKTARAGTARAADLLNRPAQRRLNRTGLCIDILPV